MTQKVPTLVATFPHKTSITTGLGRPWLGFLTKRFIAVSRNSETSGNFAKFHYDILQNISRNSEILSLSRNSFKIEKLRLTSCHQTKVFDETADFCVAKQRNMRKGDRFAKRIVCFASLFFCETRETKRFVKW